MRFEIARSFADIEVLLGTLSGTHRSSRTSVLTSSLLQPVSWWAAAVLFQQGAAASDLGNRAFGIGAAVSILLFATAILADKLNTYRIHEGGIANEHPLRPLSWSIPRSQIHMVTLVFEKGWRLEIQTTDSRKRVLDLEGSLRDALAKLYPEVGPYQVTAKDRRRWKWMALIATAALAAGGAVVWWLTVRGVFYWN